MRCILLNVSVYSTVFLTTGTKLYRSLEFFHLFFFFFPWLCCVACGILVPQPGKVLSPNHWTAKKFLRMFSS